MSSKLHIWADVAGSWRASPGDTALLHASDGSTPDPRESIRPGEVVMEATSLVELLQGLRKNLQAGLIFDGIDVHTHGSPGSIYLGRDVLNCQNLAQLQGQGIERLSTSGASVSILGCNVADSAGGELFLAEFGSLFLRGGGGEVRANTGPGYGDPFFTGDVYHPTGEWITADVSPGGAVTIRNARFLRADLIRRRIAELWYHFDRREDGRTQPSTAANVDVGQTFLGPALALVRQPPYRPSYRRIFQAIGLVHQAALYLRPVTMLPYPPTTVRHSTRRTSQWHTVQSPWQRRPSLVR